MDYTGQRTAVVHEADVLRRLPTIRGNPPDQAVGEVAQEAMAAAEVCNWEQEEMDSCSSFRSVVNGGVEPKIIQVRAAFRVETPPDSVPFIISVTSTLLKATHRSPFGAPGSLGANSFA